jgi:hypothetical protein
MFHQQDYDLSRQRYAEYTRQFEGLYAPLPEEKASFVQRLLAALRGNGVRREEPSGVQRQPQTARTEAAAK